MDLSVIIVNYNTKELLRQCLKSLRSNIKNQISKVEIIVVDNGSTDGSVEMIKKMINGQWLMTNKKKAKQSSIISHQSLVIKLIENKENLGFAKANNQALRLAQGKYILLLNSDAVVINDALSKMVEFMDEHPEAGVVGSKLLNRDGTGQPSTAPFYTPPVTALMLFGGDRFLRVSPCETREVDWVMGSCMMVRRGVIEKVGMLDENFFMYIEEVEWCYRIKKAGLKIYFYPEAKVYHLMRGSSTTGKKMAILNIYKGLIYFYQKHMPFWQLIVLKFLLKTKALMALGLGYLTNNIYLKETYAEAFALV